MAIPDPAPRYQRDTVVKPPPGKGPLEDATGSKFLGYTVLACAFAIIIGATGMALTFLYVVSMMMLDSI